VQPSDSPSSCSNLVVATRMRSGHPSGEGREHDPGLNDSRDDEVRDDGRRQAAIPEHVYGSQRRPECSRRDHGADTTLAAVLFGLLPALRVSTVDPIAALRQAARGPTLDRRRVRFQRAFVVAQIAVSLVLIFSALLFIQTFRNLAKVDTGFEQDHTLAVEFTDRASENLPPERKRAFQELLTDEIRSVPGVAAAASSTHVPLSGSTWSHFFRVVGAAGADRRASRFAYVSPGYFETLDIPIRSGRVFDDLDNGRSGRVVLVNESFVRSHLRGQDPIGATLRTIAEPGFPETTYDVIGVVGDTRYADLREENCWCDTASGSMAPIAYVPIAQLPSPYAWASVIVRASGRRGPSRSRSRGESSGSIPRSRSDSSS